MSQPSKLNGKRAIETPEWSDLTTYKWAKVKEVSQYNYGDRFFNVSRGYYRLKTWMIIMLNLTASRLFNGTAAKDPKSTKAAAIPLLCT